MSSSIPKNLDHVVLDGSQGEGGGQILRTALTLSLLTGRAFRMVKIRANRDKPGLRPQHHKAVQAAVELGQASVAGGGVGARELLFWPKPYEPRDLSIDIGTAGSTGLVLQTLHLPLRCGPNSRRGSCSPAGHTIRRHRHFHSWISHGARISRPLVCR